MTAADLARRALWCDGHPLCLLFSIANGTWIEGAWRPVTQWSIRELREFAETLPPALIVRMQETAQWHRQR